MKAGSLVKCLFQPRSSGYNEKTSTLLPMVHHVKDEYGIYLGHRDHCSGNVLFPQFGYEHVIAWSALEVMGEM